MTTRTRNFIFWIFFAIFVIATSLISLYATGYRLSLSWPPNAKNLLQQTGTLILNSKPEGATISINGRDNQDFLQKFFYAQPRQYYTPAKIKNIAPGEYLVRFELTGYWPYEKKIRIYPGEATYLEDVDLFLQNLPLKIIDAKTQEIQITSDKNYIILKDEKKIIDLKSETETQISLSADTLKTPEDLVKIIKSKDIRRVSLISSDLLVYATDWEIYLFNAKDEKHTLITRLSQQITSIAWRTDGYIVYSTANSINIINLKDRTNPTTLITLDKMSAPVLSSNGNILYFTAKIGNQEGLYKLAIK
ncbi:MAG: PEGA domain-containing protein [Patescibacteria group bacterium]|jgi:hypothetical protein